VLIHEDVMAFAHSAIVLLVLVVETNVKYTALNIVALLGAVTNKLFMVRNNSNRNRAAAFNDAYICRRAK
jgi:hypothetical protein